MLDLGILYMEHYNLAEWGELEYALMGDSGFDLRAAIPKKIWLHSIHADNNMLEKTISVPSGIRVSIPSEYEIQIRPRSGLVAHKGVMCIPSTIDSGYTGEISLPLVNFSNNTFVIHPGYRVAQAVLMAVPKIRLVRLDNMVKVTMRGDNGHGSTGLGI